ncbi:hypothetical protein EC973_004558 [Apophysomyces ossiformis]|uniref:Uncharacterized protein n=1 Tax=Apophysomyces ossiformis TaxID=679940 RepID=A0A8H7ERU0_9FUNG|nr:hypothetical protein EC973_004558 [Apophysomyces ossiformis]
MSPSFDLKTGSRLALASNEQTAYHHTMAINCSPIAMHLNHHSLTSSISAHALMRNEFILDVVRKIPFQDNCFSESLECVLQLHDENGQGVQSSMEPSIAKDHVYVEKSIASSRLPRLIDTFAFTEATTELIECLNLDFRISPSLLHAVAVLHTGCIIVDEYNIVFTLTAEVYSRSKSLDAHGETNLKSIPLPDSSTYDGLAIGIYEESDGGAAKRKLKIGSKSMNVLITMLTDVHKNEVSIGPETSLSFNSSKTRIFYDDAKLNEFIRLSKNQQTETHKWPLCVSSMRQLTSGFDKTSTYALWRATLPGFDNDLLQPATVFTVTDLPGNQGYGHGDKSVIKMASSILQIVAIAVLKKCSVQYNDMQHFDKIQQNEDVSALLQHLQSELSSDPLQLSRFLLPLCKHASQGLPKANQKIKSNVEKKLLELFGCREKDS